MALDSDGLSGFTRLEVDIRQPPASTGMPTRRSSLTRRPGSYGAVRTSTGGTARPFAAKVRTPVAIDPLLNEFSCLDDSLIVGMTLDQRRPITEGYWLTADPDLRQGHRAETYREFHDRVSAFMLAMPSLPNATVVFGHGIWFGMLIWRLLGFSPVDSDAMKSFRRFQTALPMPNCAVYELALLRIVQN